VPYPVILTLAPYFGVHTDQFAFASPGPPTPLCWSKLSPTWRLPLGLLWPLIASPMAGPISAIPSGRILAPVLPVSARTKQNRKNHIYENESHSTHTTRIDANLAAMALQSLENELARFRSRWRLVSVCLSVAALSAVAQSGPLDTWTWLHPVPQGNNLSAVVYGNGQFVAVGNQGALVTSQTGCLG